MRLANGATSFNRPFAPSCAARRSRLVRPPQANLFSKLFGGADESKASSAATMAKKAPPEVFLMAGNAAAPEFPPYTVIKRSPIYDLRLYDAYPVIEIAYSRREEGYAALGGYIDGDNSNNTRFSYSQPVIMRYYSSDHKVMQMYLGTRQLPDGTRLPAARAAEALTALPTPNAGSSASVAVAGGELVAVLKFEGFITPLTAERARKQLMAALQSDGMQLADEEAAGFFRCAQYGAVYQVGGRLNEMMLRVKP